MAEKVKGHFDYSKSQSEVLTITILFNGNELFSDFKRYDPSLSFSTENWYEIWPAKQMDPLKKKQLVLQVNDSC